MLIHLWKQKVTKMKLWFLLLALCMQVILSLSQIETDLRNSFDHYATVKPILFTKTQENLESAVSEGDELILSFEAFEMPFVANLRKNKDLLSENFYTVHQKNGQDVVTKQNNAEINCFYRGAMPGLKDSWAAVSTCKGIRGAIFDGNELYFIEPDHTSDDNIHFVFPVSDIKSGNFKCGARESEVSTLNTAIHKVHDDKRKHIEQLYLELLVVNDNGEYKKYNSNVTEVLQRNLDILNVVNEMYRKLKLTVKMTGFIVWNETDKLPVSTYPHIYKLTEDFAIYREKHFVNIYPNDVTALLTSNLFEVGDVRFLGAAHTPAVCQFGAAVVSDNELISYDQLVNAFTHEIGHTLGMNHDSEVNPCLCIKRPCVMQDVPRASRTWSECSKRVIRELHDGKKPCLANIPKNSYN